MTMKKLLKSLFIQLLIVLLLDPKSWYYNNKNLPSIVVVVEAWIPSSSSSVRLVRQREQQQQSLVTKRQQSSSSDTSTTAAVIVEDKETKTTSNIRKTVQKKFPFATFHKFIMNDHRPLGCTVEESLAVRTLSSSSLLLNKQNNNTDNDSSVTNDYDVVVTKIVKDGIAETVGMEIGDVIVGVTTLFGAAAATTEKNNDDEENEDDSIMQVSGLDIDMVRRMIGAVPDEVPLTLCIARGTNVLENHEKAIQELCENPISTSDKEIEECVINFLSTGYDLDAKDDDTTNDVAVISDNDIDIDMNHVLESIRNDNEEKIEIENNEINNNDYNDDDDDDVECLIDDIHCLWGEELMPYKVPEPMNVDGTTTNNKDDEEETTTKAPKVKPWSSRSSPSGTYVRDPRTGQMRNIDE